MSDNSGGPVFRRIHGTLTSITTPECRHCGKVVARPDQDQHMRDEHPTLLRRRSTDTPDFIQRTTRFDNTGGTR